MAAPWRALLLACFAILPLSFLTSSCGQQGTRVAQGNRDQILHMGNTTEPADTDPQIISAYPDAIICMALFEGLVHEDPRTSKPISGVAESWDVSADGLTYTFHLRENAGWSNGDPVTAHDFVFSYQRKLSPRLASEYSYMLHVIKNARAFNQGDLADFAQVGVKAVDDRTLEITLENPTPFFLSLIVHNSWYPVHPPTILKHGAMDERSTSWTRPENHVGNGPFSLHRWQLNEVLSVTNNPHYWKADSVALSAIRFYPIENTSTEERAFRSGQLHLTYGVPLDKFPVYQKERPDLLRNEPWVESWYIAANTKHPLLKNKKLRQALSHALDRELLVHRVLRSGQSPAHFLTPPNLAGYTCTNRVPTDFEIARDLLAEAGYPKGQGLPSLELHYRTSDISRRLCEAIQQMWKRELGIDITLRHEEYKVFLDTQRRFDFELSLARWIGDYADPNTFLDMLVTGGGNNVPGFSNDRYDELIARAGQTLDQEKRFGYFQEAEGILLHEAPLFPLHFGSRVFLSQPSVQGFQPSIVGNIDFRTVTLE